jgi:hypothetical protein
VRPADIARFLGIRYQHAYNVLRDAQLAVTPRAPREETEAPGPAGPSKIMLEDSGYIRVPRAILSAWSAEPGDELIVRLEDDELRGERLEEIEDKLTGLGDEAVEDDGVMDRLAEARDQLDAYRRDRAQNW